MRYSAWALIKNGLTGQRGWEPAWRSAEMKSRYDVVVIGGGGHGLATAYYLAKNHGVRNVAVLEKGWIGGGNTGRNTTVVRSNYYYPQSAAFYDFSLRLYEGLARELNYNIMLSQRGMVTVMHSRHDLESAARWVAAMNLNGVEAQLLTVAEVKERIPLLLNGSRTLSPLCSDCRKRISARARRPSATSTTTRSRCSNVSRIIRVRTPRRSCRGNGSGRCVHRESSSRPARSSARWSFQGTIGPASCSHPQCASTLVRMRRAPAVAH